MINSQYVDDILHSSITERIRIIEILFESLKYDLEK